MSECCITNMSATFDVSDDPKNENLDLAGFEAINDWTNVPGLTTHGDTGVTQNIVSLPTWDRTVVCKGKGQADAGDPEIEFCHTSNSGIDALISKADVADTNNYATRITWPDGSVEYNRGLITGPRYLKGGNEDFKRIAFTLGLNQPPVTSDGDSPS